MSPVYSENNIAPTSPFPSNSVNRPSTVRNDTELLHNSFLREMSNILYVIQGPCRQPKAMRTCALSGPKQLSTSNKYHSQCTSSEPRAAFLANVANSGHNGAALNHVGSRSHWRKTRRSRHAAKKSFQAIKSSTCNVPYASTNGFKSKAVDRNKSLYQISHKHKKVFKVFLL